MVRQLKLNGSALDSLRDLGTHWRNLEILWAVQTGLAEIDGLAAFPELKELYAAFNRITDLSSLLFNETIEIVDLEGNEVEDLE